MPSRSSLRIVLVVVCRCGGFGAGGAGGEEADQAVTQLAHGGVVAAWWVTSRPVSRSWQARAPASRAAPGTLTNAWRLSVDELVVVHLAGRHGLVGGRAPVVGNRSTGRGLEVA
jgi:hypothetical protein